MRFLSSIAAGLLAIPTACAVKLYAYGTGINGLEVFYMRGGAFITTGDISSVGGTLVDFSIQSLQVTITATSPTTTFSGTQILYINDQSGAFDQVGFTSQPQSLPSNLTTTPWAIEEVLFHEKAGTNGDDESNFYVGQPRGGVYQIYWKNDDASVSQLTGAVSVRLTQTAP